MGIEEPAEGDKTLVAGLFLVFAASGYSLVGGVDEVSVVLVKIDAERITLVFG